MEETSSSDRNRRPRSGSSRNRNQNRSGDGKPRREGGRSRRPEPKLTGFQKFIKAITFGLVDPAKKRKKGRKPSGKTTERRRIIEEPTTPRLYIGNLSYDLTDEELEAVFAPVGRVVSASVVRHGDSGRSKGFAFVEMGSVEEAKAAVSKLNDTDVKGRQMLVSGAKAEKPRNREARPPREGDREGGRDGGRERRRREDGDRPPRREGRSGDRERRGGGRGARSTEDRIEKPTRQVTPAMIEVVTTPRLAVLNLNKDATGEDIADLFDGIGEVRETTALTVTDGAATGELMVEFSTVEAAQKAVEFVDLKFFMGHQLRVKAAPGDSVAQAAPETAPVEETARAEEVAPVAETAPVEETAHAEEVAPVAEAVSVEETAPVAEEVSSAAEVATSSDSAAGETVAPGDSPESVAEEKETQS